MTILYDTLNHKDSLGTSTNWKKIKSHSGSIKNNREDTLANYTRSLQPIPLLEWQILPKNYLVLVDNNLPIFNTNK